MKLTVTVGVCGATVWDEAPTGILTDEHSACSYGQPVLLIDGLIRGPIDCRDELSPHYSHTPYQRDPSIYESDDELRARRDPEQVEFAGRARLAGYRVA